ncbi:AEC family transporter [Fonticella tunisiensis]|uniref:Malate permease n=1 Tax=Fonticella tunisiensis TaxID=1096341 RepID=A0A4R7KC60_9CLOT|nr:AEC family transporter [Fonticella tunisiensis]TDT51869.1 hypothetical protein EDD71_1174 [Fonticella tunisiensis]
MIILNSLQSILSIFIMISLGYYLTYKKWFDDDVSKLFAKLVTTISLPPLMFSNLMTNFDRNKLISSASGLIVPFLSMLITYLIGRLVSRLIRVRKERLGIFHSMFFVSNTIFIGLPINLALFGDVSVPYVLLYYIANTTLFWTLGVYGISRDGSGKGSGIFTLETVRRIFSPPLMGFIVAVIFIFLDIKLPTFLMDTFKYLGNLTTPISMLFIGITIYSIKLRDVKIDMDMIALIIGRFVISPLTILALAYFFPIPDLMKKVFVIQAAMPVMTQTAIISKAYGADHEYSAIMITISTLASLIVIPIYMSIL